MWLLCVVVCIVFFFLFFFFQAEDGIRDGHVTGVQTCALPISGMLPSTSRTCASPTYRCTRPHPREHCVPIPALRHPDSLRRSEERRVGKECRSGVWGEQ